jgi:creatinine amidohydrolase/Fe(II)-dependent formamide hydrolase-like protein
LGEYTSQRGDQHAGGVETALVQYLQPELVDSRWWPGRIDELAQGSMELAVTLELAQDMDRFIRHVETESRNGIVGDVRNFFAVDAATLFGKMLAVARQDLERLADSSIGGTLR